VIPNCRRASFSADTSFLYAFHFETLYKRIIGVHRGNDDYGFSLHKNHPSALETCCGPVMSNYSWAGGDLSGGVRGRDCGLSGYTHPPYGNRLCRLCLGVLVHNMPPVSLSATVGNRQPAQLPVLGAVVHFLYGMPEVSFFAHTWRKGQIVWMGPFRGIGKHLLQRHIIKTGSIWFSVQL